MNYMGLQSGQYRPLSPEQIETLHETSLNIFEQSGISYEQGLEDTVQMLADNGATVDTESKRFFCTRCWICCEKCQDAG